MVIALIYLANTIVTCFGFTVPLLSYLGGLSIIPFLFIYLSSFVFEFCVYHRMFLYYIVVDDIINIIDSYFTIPIGDLQFLAIHLFIVGIFLFLILYLYKHDKCNKETSISNN